MHLIITLFWLGLLVCLAMAVFNFVLMVGGFLIAGIIAGFAWVFSKLSRKKPA